MMKKFVYYWLPVFIDAALIFYFSSLPVPPLIIEIIPETLIWHMIEYAILSFLLFRALNNTNSTVLRNNSTLLAITIATLYGVIDEAHQLFVPGRTFSYYDMIADFIGSSFILTKMLFLKKTKIKHQ